MPRPSVMVVIAGVMMVVVNARGNVGHGAVSICDGVRDARGGGGKGRQSSGGGE